MVRYIDADRLIEMMKAEYKKTSILIKNGEIHLDTLAEGYTECNLIIDDLVMRARYDNPMEKEEDKPIKIPM